MALNKATIPRTTCTTVTLHSRALSAGGLHPACGYRRTCNFTGCWVRQRILRRFSGPALRLKAEGLSGFDGALELAAGGKNVAAARLADVGGDAVSDQRALECGDSGGLGHRVRNSWAGIPRDQIHFCGQAGAADEAGDLPRVLWLVGHAREKNVFERDALVRAKA